MDYVDLVETEKHFRANVVIQIGANYFCVRQPDSGLIVAAPYDSMVGSLVLNPATIDIRRVNTSIASYSFRLLDKNGILSALMLGNGASLVGQNVTIWLGRNKKRAGAEDHDFSGYYQLPITRIKKIEHSDNTYSFQTTEDTDRVGRAVYSASTALSTGILSGTTTITMRDAIDDFPASGELRIDDEILSYTTKVNGTKTFSGIIRGEKGTTPAAHDANTEVHETETITDNPVNVVLRLLTSGGGGGSYDNLADGLAISETLVDVAGLEALRNSLFVGVQVKLELTNIDSGLKFLETEILQPFNLRFSYGNSARLGLVLLDRAVFVPIADTIDEDTMISYPKWSVDEAKIVNRLKISWDYDEPTKTFLRVSEFTDDDSVTAYGLRNALNFSFKGIKESLDGETLVNDYARVLFARLAAPVAEVEVKTQIDKSLKTIGDKLFVESTKIPSPAGGLNFSAEMEVISRAINYQTNEVSFKLAFTSFTKLRSGYIAPSDLIISISSQKLIAIPIARGSKYLVGWYMRLWNEVTQTFEADAPNKIVAILLEENALLTEDGFELLAEDGSSLAYEQDQYAFIKFENNWSTALTTDHRIRFADYDDATVSQQRYCFISDDGNNFNDTKPTYKVTY